MLCVLLQKTSQRISRRPGRAARNRRRGPAPTGRREPGRSGQRPTPRRGRPERPPRNGAGRREPDRRAPGPACEMRAQLTGIHPGSRRASPARRNQPALTLHKHTSHNASPGDITESTPPGAGMETGTEAGAGGECRRRAPGSPPAGRLPQGRGGRSSPRGGGGGAHRRTARPTRPRATDRAEIGRASCRERV